MKLTKAQLIKIIKEEIMAETSPTFGLRTGDMVRHKDEPDRGVGRVVAKGSARDNFVLVLWADGSQQRHDPSALDPESIKEEFRGIKYTDPHLMSSLGEVRQALGEKDFTTELVNQMPEKDLREFIIRIAKERELDIGGIKYL
jgi:hypothetical protein